METFYLITAGVGGTLILCQFLANAFGMSGSHDGMDHDVDHDADTDSHLESNWFLGLLTFRSVAAAITFFGLGGLTAKYYQASEFQSFLVAFLAACSAFYLVAMLMKSMHRLRADGTVRMERAVGQLGRVYLTIPGKKSGSGKVTLNVQNRTVECQAMTADAEIATGSTVKVVALLGPNLVEVAVLSQA